jgi:palmitoyl transferase
MKNIFALLLLISSFSVFAQDLYDYCPHATPLLKPFCQGFYQILIKGNTELYLSGYAWHNRAIYSSEKVRNYNENAWGGGLGKGFFDEKGNWRGLFAFAFLDSHKNLEPAAGYAYLLVRPIYKELKAGIGYTVLVTMRPDLNKGIPFPGALPWASVFFKKASLAATYIPGFNKNGNVLYLLAKYTF